jgi:DNA-binding NtrC family response regulator
MGNPHSLLIVDDDLIVTELLLAILGDKYECRTAADVGDALMLLQSQPFDLVILDIGLPDCSGLAVNLYVRKTRPGIPVIVVSGSNDPATVERAKDNGVYEFLSKPFTPDQLRSVVERALRDRADQVA